jgi:asparagine synthase (glutamine-hydrolysing)
MCGLAAIITFNGAPIDTRALSKMTHVLTHRGPDDSGFFLGKGVGLGFRRLAILDLTSSGHQPMTTADGRYVLVFNGEIFNYIELRAELVQRGYEFRSTGDTEVLLCAFREWGLGCLPRFNGMWAFVIHDTQTGEVFGARDRFGVKPLYYYRDDERLLIASEIKAIRESGYHRGGTNWRTAAAYFADGDMDVSAETFVEGIRQIPAGHAFTVDRAGALTLQRYWTLDDIEESEPSAPEESFRELFESTVALRLRSDVPVGIALSGGLDSTSIVCAAARLKTKAAAQTPTLAFSFNVKDYDESQFIADTVAQTGAELKQVSTDPVQLWSTLDTVLWYHDEPVHSMTALVGFQIMKLAAGNGVKVVLTGQGADETLGGYPNYFRNSWFGALRQRKLAYAWSEIRAYSDVHGGRPASYALPEVVKLGKTWMARYEPYRRLARERRKRRLLNHPWFTRELVSEVIDTEDAPIDRSLRGALARSVEVSPLPLYLRIEDRNSMAHSVEARLPFMDFRLVKLAFALPSHWKIRGPWNKYILREAMRERIPESVRARPEKMGFPVPVARWFRNELFEAVRDTLGSRSVAERGIYRCDRVLRDLDRHRRGEVDVSSDVFRIAQFERWNAVVAAAPKTDAHVADAARVTELRA